MAVPSTMTPAVGHQNEFARSSRARDRAQMSIAPFGLYEYLRRGHGEKAVVVVDAGNDDMLVRFAV